MTRNISSFLIVFICLMFRTNAQNFEWLKSYGSKSGGDGIVAICNDKKGSVYFIVSFQKGISNVPDTFRFDSVSYVLPSSYVSPNQRTYLIKVDSAGKVKNSKYLGDFLAKSMDIDSFGNLYILGSIFTGSTGDSTFVDNQYYKLNNGKLFFLKYSNTFNQIWLKQTGNTFSGGVKIKVINKKVVFLASSKDVTSIGSNVFNLGNIKLSYLYGEINPQSGNINWCRLLFNNTSNTVEANLSDVTYFSNCYYFSGFVLYDNFNQTNDTFFKGLFVLKTDTLGVRISKFTKKMHGDAHSLHFINAYGGNLFVGGAFQDSIVWKNTKYYTGFNPATFTRSLFFIASLSVDFNERWLFKPDIIDKVPYGNSFSNCAVVESEFLYTGSVITSSISINNSILNVRNNLGGRELVFLKFDLQGNPLWAINGSADNAIFSSIAANPGRAVYASGNYTRSIAFKQLTDSSKGFTDAFLTKLSDNAIIRGAVSSGPYCAGDSIKVPYKKIGDYDTSNYFIAELSDEQGNFTGKHRELGRLKSNQNGTVTGLLPLFKVASSKLYRIRIISTSPVVQSYYKVDTLRLLIYSKDKAWAGNDTTICKGDSLQLETFGGTKWHWSPGYKIQDSTARTPFAWPDKTTSYRITISDSSGCGVPDTAYKTIKVRPEPKIIVLTPRDTSICLGGTLPIAAKYSGGDSLGYQSLWYSINSNGLWTLERQQSLKQQDTLNFTMPLSEPDSMRFILYLTDGCTPKTAFATYTLKIKKQSAQANFEFKDTSLCPGSTNALVANFTGSPKEKLSWSWQENTSITNQWVQRRTASNKQSDTWQYKLPLNWKGTKKIRVLLSDACSGLKDTALLNITPKDTLQLQLNTQDTTLCKGQLYTFKAIGKGGNKDGYKYVWTDIASGDTLSMADSLKIHADTSLTIRLVLNDGCMPKTISRQFTITVRAPLKITINNPNDTVLCDGKSLTYRASAAGGNGQFNYQWLENTTTISNKDSAAIKHNSNQATTRIIQVVLSDGCTLNNDTARINLHYKAPLSQSLNVIDSLCFGAKATLKTKASGGVDNYVYQWQTNNTTVSSTDSLKIINTQPGKFTYTSIVTDACSLPDTISIDIVNLDPLKLQLSTADSCPTGSALILSKVTGGLRSQLKINWYNKSAPIYQGSTLSINPSNYSDKIFTAIASDGCSIQNDTASLRIGSSPKVKISAINECLGDTAIFTARQLNQTKATSYQWRLNGQALAQTDSIVKNFFSQFGPYKIRLDVSSNNSQCKGSDSLTGFILVKPRAVFTLAHFERTASGIPFKFINQSSNDNTWLWQFGNGDTSQRKHPNYTYADSGKFKVTLIVSNQNKCFDTTSLLLPVMDKIEFFYPNAFSPNGNGINESFGLSANQWNKVKEYNLKIYNRWGEKVFDSDHMEEHWSGDKAQQAVYIYKANIRDVYNVLHEIEGVVELMQ